MERDENQLTKILDATRDDDWQVRKSAIENLQPWAQRPAVVNRLVELLDDADLANGQAATRSLILGGGDAGLARVARAFPALDDQVADRVSLAVSDTLGWDLADVLDRVAAAGDDEVKAGIAEIRSLTVIEPG